MLKADEMRKAILRRLEALEAAYRAREKKEQASLVSACVEVWELVFAYYLGGLRSDENNPHDAYTRALGYLSSEEYDEDLFRKGKGGWTRLFERLNDAYHRLFAKVGLDLDTTPRTVLFDAFVTIVDQLPDQRLNRLRVQLTQSCGDLEIPAGANLPHQLSADNFLPLMLGEGAA